ncbi:MAG: hypothetical protein M0Q91_06570 [Methanoregula sp.]|jgi:hypothetical protein|nr:hypothetical protein [Methanoregula sp.]
MTSTPITFTLDEVEKRVINALDVFIKKDLELLQLRVDERAISHRIADHLQRFFLDWHVDCEYNRRGKKPKDQEGHLVRPDIIIHHRGVPENLLCIEIKKEGESLEDDKIKLKNFTDPLGDDRYLFGLLLVISLNVPYTISLEWYQNSGIIHEFRINKNQSGARHE